MDDAGRWRDHPEVVKRLLAPAQELVAFAVALEFALGVERIGRQRAEAIHLHRMVDDQIDLGDRVDAPGIAAQPVHGRAQRGKIGDRRQARVVLQQHPRRHERQFTRARLRGLPPHEVADVLCRSARVAAPPQDGLEDHLEGIGQTRYGADAFLFQPVETVHDRASAPGLEGGARAEWVLMGLSHGANLAGVDKGSGACREPTFSDGAGGKLGPVFPASVPSCPRTCRRR